MSIFESRDEDTGGAVVTRDETSLTVLAGFAEIVQREYFTP